MQLSAEQKNTLLEHAKWIYSSYLALDLFQQHALTLSPVLSPNSVEKKPLAQHIIAIIQACSTYPQTVSLVIADHTYQLTIDQIDIQEYAVKLISNTATELSYKIPAQYTDTDIGTLCANRRFILKKEDNHRCHVSLEINSQHIIGGKSKIKLYRTHLLTLFNIIQKIEKEEDITNLLVALATGSGKTFVQALWLAILSLAGFTGIFALPDRLVPQFLKDIKRLLPDSLTHNIVTMQDTHTKEHNAQILIHAAQSGQQIIASNERLLDHHYHQISMLSPEQSFFIFDEQHLLMTNERQRLRLLTLNQQFLSMLLTATPDKHTYQNSGGKPVAIMSSGQKQQSGQGQFPKLRPIQAKSIAELHHQQETQNIVDYLNKMLEKCLLLFNDAIQPECISTIHALFDELPYLSEKKTNEQALRWRLQVPAAKKMLCIIEDNETLINCCDYLTQSQHQRSSARASERYKHRVYHNGNFVERESVANFFGIPDIDRQTLQKYWDDKKHDYIQTFSVNEQAVIEPILDRSLHQQLRLNMFHYLLEYILCDLTELSAIEQNTRRKHSPEAFLTLIKERYQARTADYFYTQLSQEIDIEGAQMISQLLHECSVALGNVMQSNKPHDQLRWAENWFLDDIFKEDWWRRDNFFSDFNDASGFKRRFDAYVHRNILIGVFSGMEEEETPIADSKPFSGLTEKRYALYQSGIQAPHAKKRKRTSLELLDDTTEESAFTPNYLDITETQADNYFRLGFMGIYISNKKTEGFSDPDLHTILNPVQHSHDTNNHPKKQIQAIGRDRGLDDTQFGHYIPAFGQHVTSSFDLNFLLQDDYYPELFAAEKNFDQKSIPVIGELLGKEIITWYYKHQNDDESIDPEQLKQYVFQAVAKVLRKINIQNTHHIHISREQLPDVIFYAMNKLDEEIDRTRHAYQLSMFVRVLGSILNAICEFYFFIIGWGTRSAVYTYATELANMSDPLSATQRADEIYLKIIRQTNYKDLIAQNLAAGELKAWLLRQTTIAQKTIEKNIRAYLKPEISSTAEMGLAEGLFPMLAKMLTPAKQTLLMEKVRLCPEFITLLHSNAQLLLALQEESSDDVFAQHTLTFLHQVPGLETLQAADIVNYPAQLRAHVQWLHSLSPASLQLEPELREQVIQEYASFLSQPQFVSMLDGLMLEEDRAIVALALQQDPENIRTFVAEWLDSQAHQVAESTSLTEVAAADFLQTFIRYFHLDTIKLLPDRVKDMQTSMADYQQYSIAIQIQQEILPCLVNLYPLSHRKRMLQSISIEAIETLLRTQKSQLESLVQTGTPQAIAAFFFSASLHDVPPQIDIEEAQKSAMTFIQKQTRGFSGAVKGAASYVDSVANRFGLNTGLLNSNISGLLNSQTFLDHLSLLLPFHHWEILCAHIRRNPQQRQQLADVMITMMREDQLSPEALLQAINHIFKTEYRTTNSHVEQHIQIIRHMAQGQHTTCQTTVQKNKIPHLIRKQCIPLLAKNIGSRDVRERFLAYIEDISDETLCAQYPSLFTQLANTQTTGNQKDNIYLLCQMLVPNIVQMDDLIDLKEYAGHCVANIQQSLIERTKRVLLMNHTFQEKVADLFHPQDAQTVLNCLNDRRQADILAKLNLSTGQQNSQEFIGHTNTGNAQHANLHDIADRVRQAVPELAATRLLSERLAQFQQNIQHVSGRNMLDILDHNKLTDTLLEQIQPVVQHPHFRKLLQLYMGSLTKDDLQFILMARGLDEAAALTIATRMSRFTEIVMQEDFTAFKQEFLICEANHLVDLKNYRFALVLDDLVKLVDDIMDVHGYYRQHDAKGRQVDMPHCVLSKHLSETARNIRIPAYNSFMSMFSRKIFFIQGTRLGLPFASQVFSDAHQSTLRTLEYIHHHLLRPLWWSVNNWSFVIPVIATFKAAFISLQAWLYEYLNVWALYVSYCTHNDSHDKPPFAVATHFDDSAFDVAKIINDLTPLSSEDIEKHDCPKDVITHVERHITYLSSSNLRMFTPSHTVPDVTPHAIPTLTGGLIVNTL